MNCCNSPETAKQHPNNLTAAKKYVLHGECLKKFERVQMNPLKKWSKKPRKNHVITKRQ